MKTLLYILPFLIVSCSGVQTRYYKAKNGETLQDIATQFSIPLKDLQKKNRRLASTINAGDKVYLPYESTPGWDEVESTIAESEKEPQEAYPFDRSSAFQWPVRGTLSSSFGRRNGSYHEGIDIAARKGTSVRSARSGHVIYSGNQISGYGNMVILKHAGSYATVYAHLSNFSVKKGQFVSRGQLIGKVGSTGHATGPHLHFEIRDKRIPVNPLEQLPGRRIAMRRGLGTVIR